MRQRHPSMPSSLVATAVIALCVCGAVQAWVELVLARGCVQSAAVSMRHCLLLAPGVRQQPVPSLGGEHSAASNQTTQQNIGGKMTKRSSLTEVGAYLVCWFQRRQRGLILARGAWVSGATVRVVIGSGCLLLHSV